MDEWTVVTSLAVLVGLAGGVAGPLVKLNGTISRLSAILEHVLARLDKLEGEEQRLHSRWEDRERALAQRIEGQERRLDRCEDRLSLLEGKKGDVYGKNQLEGTV